MIQYLPLKGHANCTSSLALVFLSVTVALPSTVFGLPLIMQLFSTAILPSSRRLYSAVVQEQPFSKPCGKAAISYHLPRYFLRSTWLTVSRGSFLVAMAYAAKPH